MRELYLDVEFNGTHGQLISLALYDPKHGNNFYEVDHSWYEYIKRDEGEEGALIDWVRDNVIPVLGQKAIRRVELQTKLIDYLSKLEDDDIIIYADWPEDFIHLCRLLFKPSFNERPPFKLAPSLTMKLITTPDDHKSVIPHNALEDARALYANHMLSSATIGGPNDAAN